MSTQNTHTDIQLVNSSILHLSDMLNTELSQLVEDAWSSDQDVIFLDELEDAVYLISARIIDIGNLAFEDLENGNQNIAHYNICHEWAADATSFLILWRNITFEIQKALLLLSEGQIKMDSYQKLKSRSKQVLEEASQDFYNKLDTHLSHSKGSPAQLLELSLQSNPWPTYKQQFAQIAPQCEVLVGQFKTMWNTSGLYVLVKSNFQDDFDTQKSSVEEFKKSLIEIVSLFKATRSYFKEFGRIRL